MTEKCPLVVLVYPSGDNLRFSACVAGPEPWGNTVRLLRVDLLHSVSNELPGGYQRRRVSSSTCQASRVYLPH